MRQAGVLGVLIIAGLLHAQDGQQGSQPPSYIDISESTGGQLFLFQKNEIAQSSVVMSAELSGANSALSVELQAGRILRVDHPEAGRWRLRLAGTGLFVVSVLAKAEIALSVGHSSETGVRPDATVFWLQVATARRGLSKGSTPFYFAPSRDDGPRWSSKRAIFRSIWTAAISSAMPSPPLRPGYPPGPPRRPPLPK